MANRVTPFRLRELLAYLGYEARHDNRPAPVIETDMATACLLENILRSELSPADAIEQRHQPEYGPGIVAVYDDVKIKGRR